MERFIIFNNLIRSKIKGKSKTNYYHLPDNLNDITNDN